MSKEESYKETKEFICTGCGKTIVLTKFASQKTCRCDECKANNIPVNQNIVEEALKKNPPKQRHTRINSGNTKECKCIKCGNIVTVSKFMSASKVVCDECKGTVSTYTKSNAPRINVDMSKLDKSKIQPIEEYEVNDAIIANKRLRKVVCPACGHQYIKPLMIIDGSQFGMVVDYQCQECYTKVTISEQCRQPIKRYSQGRQFDYTGTEIKSLGMHWKDSSRIANALCILINECENNNIDVDKVLGEFKESVPPYRWYNDRPVPRGFVIPPEDKWVYTISEVIKSLEGAKRDDNSDIIDTLINKLSILLKEDNDGDNE